MACGHFWETNARKLSHSESEAQSIRQLLTESQAIIKESIEKPLDTNDTRDADLLALKERVEQLTQENVELSQKVPLKLPDPISP